MDIVQWAVDALDADSGNDCGPTFGVLLPKDSPGDHILVEELPWIPLDPGQDTGWWNIGLIFDLSTESPEDRNTRRNWLHAWIPTFVGSDTLGVITDCRMVTTEAVTDDGWTPIRYRQVVTVEVTAREP